MAFSVRFRILARASVQASIQASIQASVLASVLAAFLAAAAGAQEIAAGPGPDAGADHQMNKQPGRAGAPATGAAETDMPGLARAHPERFVGKPLRFLSGEEIGPIKSIRRRTVDQDLYLIVDATAFFNDSVDFAVPVAEVERVADDAVLLPKAPGNHLSGMVYHAGDYADPSAPAEGGPVIYDD